MKRLIWLSILICTSTSSLFAIYPIVRNFSKNNHKATASQNWAITQNNSKCMYFANNNGLLEFDGQNWNCYPISNNTSVRSAMYDPQSKRIYAGASNEFGYYELDTRGSMVYRSLASKVVRTRDYGEVWSVLKNDDAVFFQSDKCIFKYDKDTIVSFEFKSKINCAQIVQNTLIVSTEEENIILSGSMFLKISYSDVLKNKKICAILPYKNGSAIFVSDFHGLFLFDGSSITRFETDIDSYLSKNQIFSAAINKETIALGTVSNGVIVKNISDGTNIHVNTASGLQNNTVLSLSFDKDNNLWLGLDKGIDYMLINSPEFSLFAPNYAYGSGYASLLNKDKLYLGTNQGLYEMTYPAYNAFLPPSVNPIPDMQGQVWCLTEIDNTLFCGHDRGAFVIEGNRSKKIPLISGVWKFLKLKKYPNYILGCSYDGLFILHQSGGEWQLLHYLKGLNESSSTFEEDKDGFIWFNQWLKGLYRLKIDPQKDSILNIEYFGVDKGLPTDRNNVPFKYGTEIIFSSEGGFFKYDNAVNKMIPIVDINNLFSQTPVSMRVHELGEGQTFFASGIFQGIAMPNNKGLSQMDSLSLNYMRDKLIIGFESMNSIAKNEILCSTENGFSVINTDKIKQLAQTPTDFSVLIKNVYSTNTKDSLIYGERLTQDQESIHYLPYSNNSLKIEFIAPEFRGNDAVTYSYFLENYDKKWSDYTSSNIKEYTKLSKGLYTFRVKAKNKFDSNIAETFYTFEILPPWYQTTLAYCIYGLVSTVLTIMLIRFVNNQSIRKVKEVETLKDAQMHEQELRFEKDSRKKEKEIIVLKNQTLESTLKHKSQELANSTLNLIRKNEILLKIKEDLNKISPAVAEKAELLRVSKQLHKIQNDIRENIEHDDDWQKFEANFDFVYEDYLKRLSEQFPQLNTSDKKLCAYLKMDLSSKEIAPLLNISVRSVEMARYRLRKKMEFSRDINLSEFLKSL